MPISEQKFSYYTLAGGDAAQNADKKKLRNGKYINTEVVSNVNKLNGNMTRNGLSQQQKAQSKKTVKRKSNVPEELESKAPMLAQDKEESCEDNTVVDCKEKDLDSNDESRSNALKKTKNENNNNTTDIEESKMFQQKCVNLQQKCEYCCQKLMSTEIKIYPGHPNGAVEEMIALTDPRLSLFTGEEAMVHESDERPQNKITHFW